MKQHRHETSETHHAIATGIAKKLKLKLEIVPPLTYPPNNGQDCYYLTSPWYQIRKWKWGTWKYWLTIHNGTIEIGNIGQLKTGHKYKYTTYKTDLNDPHLLEHLKAQLKQLKI